MQLDVGKVKVDAPAGHTAGVIRIQVAKRLQLRGVVLVVSERYRGKYNEECERDAYDPGRCGISVPVRTRAFGISCVARGYE